MRLSTVALNGQIEQFIASLDRGTLELYSGSMPSPYAETFPDLLVSLPLKAPAFVADGSGMAEINGPIESLVLRTGELGWGRLIDARSRIIADVVIKASGSEDVETADLVVNRTDLQRGGLCIVDQLTLTLPR